MAGLSGRDILVLNWRDIQHPLAGGAELYLHNIARLLVRDGARITWYTSRAEGMEPECEIDGIRIVRAGGTLSVYARAAWRMLCRAHHFDAVVDCQNGIPFFSPLFVPRDVPVVQVVHHVHQDQFATRFSAPVAAVGRFLEKTGTRLVYRGTTVAVSPSTRAELRSRLRYTGPIFIVPNGVELPAPSSRTRSPHPTLTVVTRLVPHKRMDLLLDTVATVVRAQPDLRVHVVGDGVERERLCHRVANLGLERVVTFHGRLPDQERDALLGEAWLTCVTSHAEGWGCSVMEAAAHGVPCLALRVPGIRDSVVDGVTGWLVDQPAELADALVTALRHLSDEHRAHRVARACTAWASGFSWSRSARLLARVVEAEIVAAGAPRRRRARADMSTLVEVPGARDLSHLLRGTDEGCLDESGGRYVAVMHGCDESDALTALGRHGIVPARVQVATPAQVLAGPRAAGTPPTPSDREDPPCPPPSRSHPGARTAPRPGAG